MDFCLCLELNFLKEMRAKRWSAAMDIFWRKETETEGGSGRRKKRGGNSDNARFHISKEKMNEPSPVSSHCCWRSHYSLLLATLMNLKMGTVLGYVRGSNGFHIIELFCNRHDLSVLLKPFGSRLERHCPRISVAPPKRHFGCLLSLLAAIKTKFAARKKDRVSARKR